LGSSPAEQPVDDLAKLTQVFPGRRRYRSESGPKRRPRSLGALLTLRLAAVQRRERGEPGHQWPCGLGHRARFEGVLEHHEREEIVRLGFERVLQGVSGSHTREVEYRVERHAEPRHGLESGRLAEHLELSYQLPGLGIVGIDPKEFPGVARTE